MPSAAIRADASTESGTGHLKRCLSLAQALRSCGVEVEFVVRAADLVAPSLLENKGFKVHWLGGDSVQDAAESARLLAARAPEWMVVDHYQLDRAWHDEVRERLGCKVAVVDDLADRLLAPDLLIDHNDPLAEGKYAGRLARTCKILAGPRYALLAPSFVGCRRYVFNDTVRSIGIFMGGTDPRGACEVALRACRRLARFAGPIDVVCSPLAPHYRSLARECSRWADTRLINGLPDLADFFASHDLQLGAGGGAVWERCCVGVPTIACLVADNQLSTLPRLEALGAVLWARENAGGLEAAIGAQLQALLTDGDRRRRLGEAAAALVDGRGAMRVAAVLACMAGAAMSARAAGPADEQLLLDWANDPLVRANAFNQEPIAPVQHRQWLATRLADPASCRILVVEAPNAIPAGQVRFDKGVHGWEISYSVDSSFRQCGLGARVLGTALAASPAGAGDDLLGRVKQDNEASALVFSRLGFTRQEVMDRRGAHWLFCLGPVQPPQ